MCQLDAVWLNAIFELLSFMWAKSATPYIFLVFFFFLCTLAGYLPGGFSFLHPIASCTTFSISFFVPITGPQAFDGISISAAVYCIVGVSLDCYCCFDSEIEIRFQDLGYLSWHFLILQFSMQSHIVSSNAISSYLLKPQNVLLHVSLGKRIFICFTVDLLSVILRVLPNVSCYCTKLPILISVGDDLDLLPLCQ